MRVRVVNAERLAADTMACVPTTRVLLTQMLRVTFVTAEESLPGEERFTVEIDPYTCGDAHDQQEEILGHVDDKARLGGPR